MWIKRGTEKREKERDVKCTLDRAIINPDVLSCQDGVNGVDMTQMKSRTLVENAGETRGDIQPRTLIFIVTNKIHL